MNKTTHPAATLKEDNCSRDALLQHPSQEITVGPRDFERFGFDGGFTPILGSLRSNLGFIIVLVG